MKVGDKVVIRVSAQTWAAWTPYASHFHGVVENTETRWSENTEGVEDKETALRQGIDMFFEKFDPDDYICVIGATQTDMCMDWL